MDLPRLTLVLGGLRSGKSRYAESLIEGLGGGLYLATAVPRDDQMRARVARHQARRGDQWVCKEVPRDVAQALREADRPVLLDCLTLWLANLIDANADLDREVKNLLEAVTLCRSPVVVVSNEVGLGGVSASEAQRHFADRQGEINQVLATQAERVILVVAGLPVILKDGES